MRAWELIQKLAECDNPDAIVHFKFTLDKDVIQELADDSAEFFKEPLSVDEIYIDDADIDINLTY